LKIINRLLLALFLLMAPLSQVTTAAAQEGGALIASAPETAFFPTIRFRLDAYDAEGNFISPLQPEDIQVIEDGHTLKPQSLEKIQNGLQVIIVLNVSPVMAKQFNGLSGYQIIQKALIEWARSQPAKKTVQETDDFSLVTPTGLFLIREHDPALTVKALTDYKPDLTHPQPALGSLAEALDLASDPLDQPTMKRVILYITPALPASNNDTLADLTKRAQGIGVRVNIWQLAEANGSSANQNSTNPFQQMAAGTGGHYQEVNLASPLPEIEPLFQPLRQDYQVLYTSAIRKSGSHSLSVQIHLAGGPIASVGSSASVEGPASVGGPSSSETLLSNENTFDLAVQPPNPIFLSPPASIQRYWTTPENDATTALAPKKVGLQIMVEFPDQHRRPLKSTRLYVNGKMVAENNSEPFDSFDWPLDDLSTPTRQMLRAEAIDSLNLSGSSIEIPVEVLIDQPARTAISERVSTNGIIAVAAVIAAGVVLALVLVFTGTHRLFRRKRQQAEKRLMKDPVTQPVVIRQDPSRPGKNQPERKGSPTNPHVTKPAGTRVSSAWSNPIWSRGSTQTAPARLIALDENEQPITGGAIPLTRQEITFGTDPQRATQILDSATVNELHARLYRSPDGSFYVADQDTIGGTWVNYAPVSSSGTRLEHGDLIHIGRVMFRFELANPAQPEIKVIDLEQL
jgi:hypothetical protein